MFARGSRRQRNQPLQQGEVPAAECKSQGQDTPVWPTACHAFHLWCQHPRVCVCGGGGVHSPGTRVHIRVSYVWCRVQASKVKREMGSSQDQSTHLVVNT